MKGHVRVACRPALAPGFALAGLAVDPVPEGLDPSAALTPLLDGRDVAVLLLDQSVYDALPPDLRRRVDRSTRPAVVPFQGPVWIPAGTAEDRVVALLRQAIGYRVRLR